MVDASTTLLSDAVEVSIGGDLACALRQGGQVVCWGTASSLVPKVWAFPADAGAVQATHILVAGTTACVTDSLGFVWCAGSHIHGQLGNGTPPDTNTHLTPTRVVDGTGTPIHAVGLGGGFDFVCAVSPQSSVLCWGADDSLQLGQDSGMGAYSSVALPVPGLSVPDGSIYESALGEFACSSAASAITCWGANGSGQCLLPESTSAFNPAVARSLAEAGASIPARKLSLGDVHACALDGAGQVYCWGYGTDGERGITSPVGIGPNLVPGLVDAGVTSLACGRGWTCVVDSAAHVRCFGTSASYGTLGDGKPNTTSADPVTVVDLDGGGALAAVDRIYSGGPITCAVLATGCGPGGPGPVVCWGYGPDVGGSTTASTGIPQPVRLP
jgi:alpha-tubulin suppressor-like RCC1 family protein